MPTQENNNSDEESINSGDHATSYERHRERNSKKTTTKDVSGVNIGNLSQLIKKKKGADDDDNFDELEKKRKEAQALIKSAELRENLRTGPWILIVNLECAKGLRNADIIGKSDPFCDVSINGSKVGKTKVINNNLNPIWNYTLRLELDLEKLGNSWARTDILIECYDYDLSITGNDFLGRVHLHGEDLMRTLGLAGNPEDAIRDPTSYPFRDPPKGVRKKSKRATGELIMSLSLLYAPPPENRAGDIGLKINIARAEHIMAADAMTGTSDPYLRVFWEHKEVHKTKVKKLTLNPKWDEDIVCKLPAGADLAQTQLRLDMYDRDLVGKDDFLGRCTLFASDMIERVGKSTYIRKMPGPDAPQKYRFKKRPRGDENKRVQGVVYLGLTLEDDWSDIEALVKSKDGTGMLCLENEEGDGIENGGGGGGGSGLEENDSDARGKHARAIGLKDEEEETQLRSISWLLAGGKMAKAQDVERTLLQSAKERVEEGSLEYASVMDHIGHQRLRAANYDEAFQLMDKALMMRQKMYDYPAVAISHDSLGQLAYQRGFYDEAELMLNRALAARIKLLGENHPATARTMRTIGQLYRSMGKPTDSFRMLTHSSEIIKKNYGEDSLPMASSMILLARHWRREGKKHKLSCRMCKQVLNIRDFKLGPHHPGTAVALAECAAAFRARGMAHAEFRDQDMVTSVRYMERCLAIKEHLFGPRSLRLAKTLTNLAHLYRGVGQHDKSLHAFSRVYELRRERLGEDHPLTLVSLSGKAAAMTHQHTLRDENGDVMEPDLEKEIAVRAEAKKLLLKALNTSLDKLGRHHPVTGKCFKNYVFTKTEEEVDVNRVGLNRAEQEEEQELSNYLYCWERWLKASKTQLIACFHCECIKKKESIDKIQPKLSAIERNTNRPSLDRSGSFLGRLVRKGRRQYMDANRGDMNIESKYDGADKSPIASEKDEDGNIVDVGSDPMGLADKYSALIVQHMDFKTNPNQTGVAGPVDLSLLTDDGAGKTDVEKLADQKAIDDDREVVQNMLSKTKRPDTPASINTEDEKILETGNAK